MGSAPAGLHVPEVIRSERLELRAPHPDFAPEMQAAIRESIDELRPWMAWAQEVPTVEQSRAQLERSRGLFLSREDLQLILFRGDRIVGSSGLHRIDWSVPAFETGYWVRTSDAGQGYVTEAVDAITELAFDALSARRLEIRASPLNTRSLAVAERLGFALEGVLRHDALNVDGSIRNTAIYAKIA